jgi:SAM-dependent methyltransferase
MSDPRIGDAFGGALLDRFDGRTAHIVIERDDGWVAVDHADYFSEPAADGLPWSWIRERLGDRVLDIGAGAGRAAIELQRGGTDVVPLDVSAGAIEVCRRRGVRDVFVGTVGELAASGPPPFDSFLCLGNNLGLIGSPSAAPAFFDALRRLGTEDCRVVGTMLDPYGTDDPVHLAYHDANRAAGRRPGEIRLRVRHRGLATDWFPLWWASVGELTEVADDCGWDVIDVLPGTRYAAELRPR